MEELAEEAGNLVLIPDDPEHDQLPDKAGGHSGAKV